MHASSVNVFKNNVLMCSKILLNLVKSLLTTRKVHDACTTTLVIMGNIVTNSPSSHVCYHDMPDFRFPVCHEFDVHLFLIMWLLPSCVTLVEYRIVTTQTNVTQRT